MRLSEVAVRQQADIDRLELLLNNQKVAAASGYMLKADLSGGTTGQVLTKSSNTNYAWAWATPSAGGGGSLDDILALQAVL